MSEVLLSELVEILKEENRIYEDLLEVAENKKQNLINNEIDSLFDHIESDQEYIEEVSKLEDKRLEIIKEIEKDYAINSDELSYLEFVGQLPDKWADKLNPVREELLETLEEFHVINEENKKLIEEAVKFNKFSIDLIVDNLNNNQYTYHDKNQSSPRLLDKKG
ncbi:MAG TPA: flagellar protein FlgN [Halanaerobiales bacterium]|nr:flagellar protein FlgN [Halanaerobiales bacterium]